MEISLYGGVRCMRPLCLSVALEASDGCTRLPPATATRSLMSPRYQ